MVRNDLINNIKFIVSHTRFNLLNYNDFINRINLNNDDNTYIFHLILKNHKLILNLHENEVVKMISISLDTNSYSNYNLNNVIQV